MQGPAAKVVLPHHKYEEWLEIWCYFSGLEFLLGVKPDYFNSIASDSSHRHLWHIIFNNYQVSWNNNLYRSQIFCTTNANPIIYSLITASKWDLMYKSKQSLLLTCDIVCALNGIWIWITFYSWLIFWYLMGNMMLPAAYNYRKLLRTEPLCCEEIYKAIRAGLSPQHTINFRFKTLTYSKKT